MESRLIVVQDQPQPCPYLPGLIARMPLRLPIGRLSGEMADALLVLGYRRSGDFVYRTQCANCVACEPTRVRVEDFVWTASLRRVLKRGDANFHMHAGTTQSDPARVALFNSHRQGRHLARDEEPIDEEGYRSFLVESCCDTVELSFWYQEQLAAVSIVDQTRHSLSAVYTYFDPRLEKFSLGTYAILKQVQRAERLDLQYVYLGMYVASNAHLNYKARFLPQQRFIQGKWRDVARQ
ncbi:MAG: arginyltransferase [Planctomycetaceae bacterium]